MPGPNLIPPLEDMKPEFLRPDPIQQAVAGAMRTLARPTALRTSVTFSVPEVPPVARNPLTKSSPIIIKPTSRPMGKIAHLSQKRRMDLMLIPAMLWRLFSYGASDDKHGEAEAFRGLLADAMVEPVNGEGLAVAERLGRRVQREAREIMDEHFLDQPNAKVGMEIFFAMQQLLEEGVVELVEGSAMADALFQLYDMCEWFMRLDKNMVPRPKLDAELVEKSIRKQARKFAEALKDKGYFR
jgi:hypothetical protein